MHPRTDYKLAYSEAFYAALEEGASETQADEIGRAAQLGHMERIIDAADDVRAERKLWGNG